MENVHSYLLDSSYHTSYYRIQRDFDYAKQSIERSLKDRGFLILEDAIPRMEEYYELAKQFFDLPLEEKLKCVSESKAGVAGYTPYKQETALGETQPDLKEMFHVGPSDPKYTPNVWPQASGFDNDKFKSSMTHLYYQFKVVGDNLLKSVARMLDFEDEYISSLLEGTSSLLRFIKYSALKAGEEGKRAAAHTGINLFGLLPAATSPGLQFYSPDKKWYKSPSIGEHMLAVNMGEMFEYISNGVIQSTLHRVDVETKHGKTDRYAVAFFYQPDIDTLLYRGDEQIKAGDLLLRRIKDNGMSD